jgi:hypothetical protein
LIEPTGLTVGKKDLRSVGACVLTDEQVKKTGKHERRNNDFKACIESDLIDIDKMTKRGIHEILMDRNFELWQKGFEYWWKQSPYKSSSVRLKSGDF